MKKLFSFLLIVLTLLSLAGCGKINDVIKKAEENKQADIVLVPNDVLDPGAIYTLAVSTLQDSSNIGKTVQAEGEAYYSEDSSTGYYIRISDQVCCTTDIEFSLPDGMAYPEDGTYFQLFAKINTYKNESGKETIRFDGTKVVYEDELREMYEEE